MLVDFILKQKILGYDLRSCNVLECNLLNDVSIVYKNVKEVNTESKLYKIEMQLEDFAANLVDDDNTEIAALVHFRREISDKMRLMLERHTSHNEKHPTITTTVAADDKRSFEPYDCTQPTDITRPLLDFCNEIKKELDEYASRVFKLIRWRSNSSGPANQIYGTEYLFSFDGKQWHRLPHTQGVFIDVHRFISVTDSSKKEILEFFQIGIDEPLGHSLFREAWRLQKSNPRSSIIMGISALEIGIKECISNLQPETLWLLENSPTPPLVQILNEYIPKLPFKILNKDRILLPSKRMIEDVKDGISMRNKLIHTGKIKLNQRKIGGILLTIEDLLWLLDYYKGFEWAIKYIRPSVVKELASRHS